LTKSLIVKSDRFAGVESEKPGMFNAKTQRRGGKLGNGCPRITRMNTNEYFAVNLILRHKIKFTANASVLLVPISAIRG